MRSRAILAGSTVFHGTGVPLDEFDERYDGLEAGSFLSDSQVVAQHFAERSGRSCGGVARVISFRVDQDIQLPLIESRRELEEFCESRGIGMYGVEEMREGMLSSGEAGWLVAGNYPCGGADILLVDTGQLAYVATHALGHEGEDLLAQARRELDGCDGPGFG